MSLNHYYRTFLPAIEAELQAAVARANGSGLAGLHQMLAYHMGWEGEGAGSEARGKRIRPILTLLVTASAGCNWQPALPAASAVELIHNFSLIHDDIEDNSPMRRGRQTIWKKWGIAQATNTGDAMLTLAHLEIHRLATHFSYPIVIRASNLLHQTCLHLTQGQYLDLSYEDRSNLTEADYWPMVGGKTAALLSACAELGALLASTADSLGKTYQQFGYSLGLAFQAQDDLLGIWGDAKDTGKSIDGDLVTGKKSLPVLYGLCRRGVFYKRWLQGPILPTEAPQVAQLLESDGALNYVQQQVRQLTDSALLNLEAAKPQGKAGEALRELTYQLLGRQS
jgi:geranylgeranyl diphosphate synthase type I